MNAGKKIEKYLHMSPKVMAVLSVVAFLLLMLPIIYIGKYDKPVADDYGYSAGTHQAWLATGSVMESIGAALDQVEASYLTWQGTFSSIFMMAMMPASFDYRLYKLVPALMVFMLSFASFFLCKTVWRSLLQKNHCYWLITGSALAVLLVDKMYTAPSGLFWYNAAVHYTFMHSLMIILLALCIKMVLTEKLWKRIVLLLLECICAIAVGGSNYATSLMGAVSMFSLIVLLIWKYRKKSLLNLVPFVICIVSFIISIAAPGNAYRQVNFAGMDAISSILNSFKSAFHYCYLWMDWFTFFMLLLLVPVLWNGMSHVKFRFPFPGLVMLYSVCIIATGFTSSYYGMGSEGVSRTHNVIKISYQILLLVNEGYLLGWIKNRFKLQEKSLPLPTLGILGLGILMICTVLFAQNKAGTFTTYAAIHYVRSGEAPMFYNEYMERKALLESDEFDVVLKPYQFRPWLLYIDDITTDDRNWRNMGMSRWYGKLSVRLEE